MVLRLSVVMTCVMLGTLILTSVGLNTLGEPFGDHLMALSIAISRLVYGTEGLVGLEQVLEILKQIPSVSVVLLDSSTAYENYQLMINGALRRATLLDLGKVDLGQIHAYVNDQAYLYYVILAFFLFGIKIQSLSYLWLLVFVVSVLSFLVAYREKISNLLLLWCLLVSITVVVISNPGVGVQLLTVYNYRFIPVLALIPLLHIVLSMNGDENIFSNWPLLLAQIIIFDFVLLARGSAQWMLIAVAFSAVHCFCCDRRTSHESTNGSGSAPFAYRIVSLAPLIVVLVVFLLSKSMMPKLLHEEYDGELWSRSHVVWHAAVIGMTTDPILMRRYVCSDEPLVDQLIGFRPILCDEVPRRYPRLVYDILQQPSDMDGFHAAVRYLRTQGSGEQLGAEIRHPGHFNLKWARYDEVIGEVYFDMLRKSPVDALYMYVIVKPLRYLKEAVMYVAYFWKGIVRAQSTLGVLSMLAVIFSIHLYLVRGFRHLVTYMQSHIRNESKILLWQLFLIYISSLVPSILFYSQSHTIADSVVALLAMGLFLHVILSSLRVTGGLSS